MFPFCSGTGVAGTRRRISRALIRKVRCVRFISSHLPLAVNVPFAFNTPTDTLLLKFNCNIQKRLLLTEFCASYLARSPAMSTLRFKICRIDFFSRQNRFVARCLVREQLMWLNIKITLLIMTLFCSRLLLKCQFRLALVRFSTLY